ncbi:Uma2 family endonuclease [Candidatus Amarolinea aalborgensis]|uniref:Uma2 family endonuclease n=1 Tax=Candidatus Amarolinea aalborgensis TaxID=2249329 RepID=UPI003BF99A81
MAVLTAPPKRRTKPITGNELLAMGDIGPSELIDGRIVTMTPTGDEHGTIEFNLGGELRAFVRQHRLGRVTGGEVGIYTRRNPDRVRAADIAFISTNRMAQPVKGYLAVAPDLVVDIMSPDDRWQDVREKLAEYFAIGVTWVWIVEPSNRKVLVFRSPTAVEEFGDDNTLRGEGVLAGFALKVADLFDI